MEKKFITNIDNTSLDTFIDNLADIKTIDIASAFLSDYGVNCLERLSKKENLGKDNINIYLGKYFSNNNPSDILIRLTRFAYVKIVFYNKSDVFHAKTCFVKNKNGEYICYLGSSNYTKGGLKNNLELNYILHPNKDENDQLRYFFMALDSKSTFVDTDIIGYYKRIEKRLQELNNLKKDYEDIIKSISSMNDPFDVNRYNWDGQLFIYEDYECLFSRNAVERNLTQRNILQSKLLEINKRIYSKILKLNLHHHWKDNHITSLSYPCVYNRNYVGWMGVRYGKTKNEIDNLNTGMDHNDEYDIYGFQKHGCIQYSLDPEYFSTSIFHAVPYDAVDRYYLHENYY